MSKSKKANTKPFNFNKEFVKVSNTYDNTNYIYDGSDDTINTEADMLKKFTAQEKYKLYKQVANNQEKKEFRDIERKYKKSLPYKHVESHSREILILDYPLMFMNFLIF